MFRRLKSMFVYDSDYWRLMEFIILVALILLAALNVLSPRVPLSGQNSIVTPFQIQKDIDYGMDKNNLPYPAPQPLLKEEIRRDEMDFIQRGF